MTRRRWSWRRRQSSSWPVPRTTLVRGGCRPSAVKRSANASMAAFHWSGSVASRVVAHALADGLGGGTDEAVAGVVEGHDAGGHAAVDGLAGRAIELRLEHEWAGPLERRHQGRTRGRSTESRPAAVRSSGTSTGGLTS